MVNTRLATANDCIWGAGDVCQIWLAEENRYRFSYEWNDEFTAEREDFLQLDERGELQSSFWDYD